MALARTIELPQILKGGEAFRAYVQEIIRETVSSITDIPYEDLIANELFTEDPYTVLQENIQSALNAEGIRWNIEEGKIFQIINQEEASLSQDEQSAAQERNLKRIFELVDISSKIAGSSLVVIWKIKERKGR